MASTASRSDRHAGGLREAARLSFDSFSQLPSSSLAAPSGAPFIRSSACLCVRSAGRHRPPSSPPPSLFDLLVTSLPAFSRRSGSVVAGSVHPNKVNTPANHHIRIIAPFSGHPAASSCEPLQPLLDVLLIFVFKRPSSVPGPDPHPPARPAILKQYRRSSHRLRGTLPSPQPRLSLPPHRCSPTEFSSFRCVLLLNNG